MTISAEGSRANEARASFNDTCFELVWTARSLTVAWQTVLTLLSRAGVPALPEA